MRRRTTADMCEIKKYILDTNISSCHAGLLQGCLLCCSYIAVYSPILVPVFMTVLAFILGNCLYCNANLMFSVIYFWCNGHSVVMYFYAHSDIILQRCIRCCKFYKEITSKC